MRLPEMLQDSDNQGALIALRRYYGTGKGASPFTGARFDTWDSTGTRWADCNRFTADDLVAVTFLSVNVPAKAAVLLLDTEAERFADLLTELGDDQDLEMESREWSDDWVGWQLWKELMGLPDVGATIASKLFARKRPKLRPIYDSVVGKVIGSSRIWEPLRDLLASDPALHKRLLSLKEEAELPDEVSAIRVFDVVAWMEGKHGPA